MPQLVVITEQLLAPVPGGTGRYTRELARALAATAPAGWEVGGVVARHPDPAAAVIPGVAGPRVLPLPPRALVAAWEQGLPLWPGGDAVHAPTPLAPPAGRRGRRLVVTVHDTVPWTHPETLTRRGALWHRKVIRRAADRADALVVPTAAVAAELGRHAPGQARVHVVGEGVPEVLAVPPSDETVARVTARLGLPNRYVLAVGTIEPRKGVETLVEAMGRSDAPDLPLVLAGAPGWGGVEPRELARRHYLPEERLHLLGRISDEELAVVLHRATVLAAPSMAEGFGLPVLEAMAAGVPVVHSDAPALVEVAGGAGVVVKRGDAAGLARALRAVVDDEGRRAGMAEAGRRRAARHRWEDAAEAVWRIHLELHGSVRRGSR
ncbi:Glycosyltransferase involved in cell wall bisynthesis [Streptoalloteichus tenebrarius]|uniref:Glycosyltransferase involved in cell wall bisynthesis n=1 Tax=Streptoalloteichus tenebrarius (strain ATCC 17920 / DSM 40477 / JCM 4838 / CBS 697.72 / NBRC 16177 / NCIMB 11028 / NRRL B-12390 / A12253. 1 / ISP 5477) TaxID=1933 RepID=A0ABT1HT22_STRSD|nr:glycosyltransferase family 1 protein [Streptoalloteichus tenebrarius]MCP2258652.1 Glycosyltransferase involved in cell wall bisynthesis [Streptoalloteichus tenebrarius]